MYHIAYHRLVLEDDFTRISLPERKRIVAIIDKKLSVAPEHYGKPLSGNLNGCFSLRVDPWRIIYRVKKMEIMVLVLCVGPRKDLKVYKKMAKRIKKLM